MVILWVQTSWQEVLHITLKPEFCSVGNAIYLGLSESKGIYLRSGQKAVIALWKIPGCFFLHSTVAEMDWLTQGSGAKQQALLSSKTETPNKTASVQELQCCKEPFSSQVEPYNLPYCVLAAGSRGHHCVSGAEEWGRDSCGVKTTTWKKSLLQKQWSSLSKHFDALT